MLKGEQSAIYTLQYKTTDADNCWHSSSVTLSSSAVVADRYTLSAAPSSKDLGIGMSLHLHLRRRQCIGILVVISFVAVVLLPAALGVPWSNGEFQEQNPEDYNGLELDENVDHVLQRREWCARWGDSCVPDSKLKFAQCCQGLRCDCGSPLRGTGRCQCKKESVFGR